VIITLAPNEAKCSNGHSEIAQKLYIPSLYGR
jgi:hypothetical protein